MGWASPTTGGETEGVVTDDGGDGDGGDGDAGDCEVLSLPHFFGPWNCTGIVVLGHDEVILPSQSFGVRGSRVGGNEVDFPGRKRSLFGRRVDATRGASVRSTASLGKTLGSGCPDTRRNPEGNGLVVGDGHVRRTGTDSQNDYWRSGRVGDCWSWT